MSYLTELMNEFSTPIRSRGQHYYHADRVKVASMTIGNEAVFKVRGSQVYDVRLRYNDSNNLVRTCTCPYFGSGSDCKHIWAAILEAEDHDFFLKTGEPGLTLAKLVTPPRSHHFSRKGKLESSMVLYQTSEVE